MRRCAPVLLLGLIAGVAHAQGVTSPAPPIIPVTPAAPLFSPPIQPPMPQVQTPGTPPPSPPGMPPSGAVPTPAPDLSTPDPSASGTQEAPTSPGAAPDGSDATATPPFEPAPPPPNDWQPRATVELQALDKVTARTVALTGKIGEILHFGSLSITVTACLARPPDEKTDYTAFLNISDSHEGAPGFQGWMLADEPGVSMLEHPLYDIRLTACGA
jgi:hypothetical protein